MKQIVHVARMFLVQDDQILLGAKKYGMGAQRIMAMGGKLEAGETPEAAAIRETKEESGLVPLDPIKVAQIHCKVQGDQEWEMVNHVYMANNWEGELTESDEMTPEWFFMDMVPFDRMWPDNLHWLPHILDGNGVVGEFTYDQDEQLISHSFDLVDFERLP